MFLGLEDDVFEGLFIDVLHHPAKGGLAGRGIAPGLPPYPQGAALGLAHAFGELGPVLLSPGRAAQVGQHGEGHQRPERINPAALAVIGQALELIDQGANLGRTLRAAGPGFGFDRRPSGFEWIGLQAAAGVWAQFASEEAFGFVVRDVEIAAHAAKAVGLSQLLPTAGGIDGAAELLGIHEGFDQRDRMAVTGLPVGRQTVQGQAQGARARPDWGRWWRARAGSGSY